MNARPNTNSGGVSPCALPERETGLPPEPSPATYKTILGDRVTEAQKAEMWGEQVILEQQVRNMIHEFRHGVSPQPPRRTRGMPVSPELTPVQRLAQRIPGTPGDDSFARRAGGDRKPPVPTLPGYTRQPPRRDAAWMMCLLALLAIAAGTAAMVSW